MILQHCTLMVVCRKLGSTPFIGRDFSFRHLTRVRSKRQMNNGVLNPRDFPRLGIAWGACGRNFYGEEDKWNLWFHVDFFITAKNLVDSASSHTLVSKIKPCMCKFNDLTKKLRMAHYISYSLFDSPLLLGYP